MQVLESISVEEAIATSGSGISRQYTLRLRSFPESKLPKEAQVTFDQVEMLNFAEPLIESHAQRSVANS